MGIPIHAAAAFVFIAILITKTFRALSFSISRELGFRPPGVRASYTIRSFSDRAPVRARRGSRTAEASRRGDTSATDRSGARLGSPEVDFGKTLNASPLVLYYDATENRLRILRL